MRGELTHILASAAEELQDVTHRYCCVVIDLEQDEKSAIRLLSDGDRAEEFTAIIGADGATSKVRRLASPAKHSKTRSSLSTHTLHISPSLAIQHMRFQTGTCKTATRAVRSGCVLSAIQESVLRACFLPRLRALGCSKPPKVPIRSSSKPS